MLSGHFADVGAVSVDVVYFEVVLAGIAGAGVVHEEAVSFLSK